MGHLPVDVLELDVPEVAHEFVERETLADVACLYAKDGANIVSRLHHAYEVEEAGIVETRDVVAVED